MKTFFKLLIFFFTSMVFSQESGSIVGKLTDMDYNNEPLPFANIFIKETTKGITSDIDGLYAIENVKPGTYTIVYSFLGYETVEIPNVTVVSNKVTNIDMPMSASAAALSEVVITTTTRKESEVALLLEQKNATVMKQSIGAEEISRKAISNVEEGLTKISGISKVQDRGIFVRGLDDRYNYLLVNGLPLASSDPELKIIPLGYISSNIVGSIDVFKTFDVSLYQDFAGATFQVNTIDSPVKPTTVITIGTEYNTNTSLKDFYSDDIDGMSSFFGYTGNSRSIPAEYGSDIGGSYNATPEESANLFKSSWTPKKSKSPLDTRFGISHGQRLYTWKNSNVGLNFSLNFRNNHLTQTGVEGRFGSEGTKEQDFQVKKYEYTTQKSALLSLNYNLLDKLSLTLNTIYLQNSSSLVSESKGLNNGFTQLNDVPFFIRDTRYTENDVLSQQLIGNYQWQNKKHQIDFGASYTKGNNQIPDRRVLRTADEGENAQYITTNGINPFRFFQELNNTGINGKVEYKLGFNSIEDDYTSHLKFGYNIDHIKYDFFNRTITASFSGTPGQEVINTNDPEAFFQNGFDNGYLKYSNVADPTRNSFIIQFINAGYVNYSKQWNKLLVDLGMRVEYAYREIEYKRPLLDNETAAFQKLTYDPVDYSPVVNLKYHLNDKSNLRFAASKTTTRPRQREILPVTYQKGDGNQVIGNPELENSTNYNIDLKYELFPSRSEIFAVGVFGKYIENPIERLFRATSVGYLENFDNFDSASIYGLEIESRINFGETFNSSLLNDLTLGANGILMTSTSTTDNLNGEFGQITNKERKLQGASDWGVNVDLGYQITNTEKYKSSVNFIFNTYGKRIFAVGVEGADDIFEKPINQLDFTWNNEINDRFSFRISIKNILNEETLFTQKATQGIGSLENIVNTYESFDQGINIGLNFTYKL